MISLEQCRAGRALLGWSAVELAASAKVGVATVRRFESGQPVQPASINALQGALEHARVVFMADGDRSIGGGAGVRLADLGTSATSTP